MNDILPYYDVIIIGSGVSGLSTAFKLDEKVKALILSKSVINDTTTFKAQGGIAVPISDNDIEQHIEDTLKAGAYFNNKEVVKYIIGAARESVNELIKLGLEFDKDKSGKLARTKEGGHSASRILHWGGDITGQGIQNTLLKVLENKNIDYLENCFLSQIIIEDNSVIGIKAIDIYKNKELIFKTKSVVMATGGIGQIFRETTAPDSITGDGIMVAYNTGAEIVDMEFLQFHPTTFYFPGAPRFLISEAVRGEGGILVNNSYKRFMQDYDSENMELAPRDIVSRSILFEIIKTNSSNVFLDLKFIDKETILERFPNIYQFCLKYKIDITKDLVPVFPAAHYTIGGIKTDFNAETNIDGLFACGECACTGFHGANRLASNSLLEGLVMGLRTGTIINEYLPAKKITEKKIENNLPKPKSRKLLKHPVNINDFKIALKTLMWKNAGILRKDEKLQEANLKLKKWKQYLLDIAQDNYNLIELKNMTILSELLIHSAIWRKESRGTHYRTDFPYMDKNYNKHLVHKLNSDVEVKKEID